MRTKVVLALRHKIILAFVLFLIGGLLFAGLVYNRHTVIQNKLKLIEMADDLINNALEVRRYEKNYFLYGASENFDLMMNYLTKVERQIRHPDLKEQHVSLISLDSLRGMLAEYRQAVMDYENLKKTGHPDSGLPTADVLADRIRESGRQFTENMIQMVKTERRHVDKLVDHQKKSLFYSLGAFFLLSVGVAYYLNTLIISPLSRIEKAAKAVIEGDLREIPNVQGSTEVHSLIAVLNTMIKELDKKSEQLIQREKMAALGTLTSGVAHELNNPLSNISSSTQILLEEIGDTDPAFQKSLLAGIEEQVDKARDIVKSLLEFAREKEFEPLPVDIESLIKSTLKLAQAEIPPEVDVKVDVPYAIEAVVDQRRLSQALLNLIFNGVQAMEGAGGRLCIGAYFSPRGRNLVLEVSDTGVGIPGENLAKVFDPFFSTKEEGGGTGLGLYVTYGIIQKHHGSITVTSEPNKGTKFMITLPLKQDAGNHV